ncbi:hypothetical protein GNZ24_12075 [Burkholderia thailandensis]|nr:hypothetical protein A8H35_12240 [Burkholderia thailandensis]AWY66757.1 hypothetical protein A8H36_16195 [Burkholderia thailandensis]MUV20492.1 hypothetical protein [Burkholderia thailandensis]MUV27749.1 hypothetical protein [Burkholderia thailandensis]NBC90970.1 hypothetical protein [Burkholderia thailandensis]
MIHSVPIKRKRRARRPRSTPCKSVKKRLILAEKARQGRHFGRWDVRPGRRSAARPFDRRGKSPGTSGGETAAPPLRAIHRMALHAPRRASAALTRVSSNRCRHTSTPSSSSTGTSSS